MAHFQPAAMPDGYDNNAMEEDQFPPSYNSVVQNPSKYGVNPSHSHTLPVVDLLYNSRRPLGYENNTFPTASNHNVLPTISENATTSIVIVRQPLPLCTSVTLPRDYTTPAFLVCIFCCLPMGLAAIHYAKESKKHVHSGHMADAYSASRKSRNFILGGIILGCVFIAIVIGFLKFAL